MKSINDLKDLFIDQLRKLYHAEKQKLTVLPKLAHKAEAPSLKLLVNTHLEETEQQIKRIERVFYNMHVIAKEIPTQTMEGLIEDTKRLVSRSLEPNISDAAVVSSLQQIALLEIASYNSLKAHAENLGLQSVAHLLEESLEEEKLFEKRLLSLTQEGVQAGVASHKHSYLRHRIIYKRRHRMDSSYVESSFFL